MIQKIIGLQKESPLPLYYQLKEIIKKKIECGELNRGDLVPSERELVEHYEISRPTVRQAINELVAEGLLTREKGRGTFVSRHKISQWFLESMYSFREEMEMKGVPYLTKLINIETILTTSELTAIFGSAANKLYRLERLRYVKNEPFVLVTTYIPCELALDLDKEDLENKSLYDILQHKYGLSIGSATRILEVMNVSDEESVILGVEPISAIQLIRTTAFLEDKKPFEYSIARYRGDLSNFTVHLKFKKEIKG